MINILIAKGSYLDSRTISNETPIDYAWKGNHKDISEYLHNILVNLENEEKSKLKVKYYHHFNNYF